MMEFMLGLLTGVVLGVVALFALAFAMKGKM